jgi:adenine-specific DNA methylase
VIVQLARILGTINRADLTANERQFLLLCFAAIIRNCSNADPTPVSGLEVTAHMKKKEREGRAIDPITAFAKAVSKNLDGAEAYAAAVDAHVDIQVEHADARKLSEHGLLADVIITSPPYHNAVDYYRRHQLEMYWLKLVVDRVERLDLLPGYIGRPHVAKRHSVDVPGELPSIVARWDARMRSISPRRADDFLQYISSMRSVAAQLATTLPSKGKAVFVVGNSKFQGEEIAAVDIFPAIMQPDFRHSSTLWYPVKNRYMSYARRNGADINREYVLVFEKAA